MNAGPISELVHRYADAVTHRDEAAWTATWAADAHWKLFGDMEAEGLDAIVALWRGAVDGFDRVIQTVLNGHADLDGPDATGRWYVQEHGRLRDGTATFMLGQYDDRYTRLGDGWVFAERLLTVHYLGAPDLSGCFTLLE